MRGTRYTAEFKAEAIKQITERGHGVVEVSKRLGVSDKSLYAWLKQTNKTIYQTQKTSLRSIRTRLFSLNSVQNLFRASACADILPLRTY